MNPVRPTKSTRPAFGIQSAIAASTAVAGVATTSVLQAQSPTKNNAHSSAFETETGGQTYHLPRDHAMHGGDWYKGADEPVVGHSFCEYMWATFDSPLGKDISYDPAIIASPCEGTP